MTNLVVTALISIAYYTNVAEFSNGTRTTNVIKQGMITFPYDNHTNSFLFFPETVGATNVPWSEHWYSHLVHMLDGPKLPK